MKYIFTTLVCSILSVISAHAGPLHVLSWDQNISSRDLAIAFSAEGTDSKPILNMHHLKRSAPIKLPKRSNGIHILVNDKKTEEGNPLTVPFTIPEGVSNPLLLILPNKSDPSGLRPLVIDDSTSSFKWGSMRFINVTGEELVFRYDKKNILIAAGWKPVDLSVGGNKRNMATSFYLRKNLKRPPLYSSIWKHRNDLRKLIIIVPSKDTTRGILDFKFIVENRAVVEAQASTE